MVLFYMCEGLCDVCVSTTGVYRDLERDLEPLELKFKMVVNRHVGARDQAWVLHKVNQ